MKKPHALFALIVIAVITTVVVVGCAEFPELPSFATYSVQIGGKQRTPVYVTWKGDGSAFYRALNQLRQRGQYCLCVMETPRSRPHKIDGSKCKEYASGCEYECPTIKTASVTKSKAADEIAAGGSAANDPNVTYKIQSSVSVDLTAVLDALTASP